MPKLLTRALSGSLTETPPCDFGNPENNVLLSQEVTPGELKANCDRYWQLLQTQAPALADTMIRASSFTADSLQQLLSAHPDATFFRVYYGVRENGEHLLFMGPVQEEEETVASFTTESEESLYVENCCHCPPRLNCPKDELLEWGN